jgi:hypothetical protein
MKKNVLMMVTAFGLIVTLNSCKEKICFDKPPAGFSGLTPIKEAEAINQVKEFKKLRDHIFINPGDNTVDSTLYNVFPTYYSFSKDELLFILKTLEDSTTGPLDRVVFMQTLDEDIKFSADKPFNSRTRLLVFGLDKDNQFAIANKEVLFYNDMKRCPPDQCIDLNLPEGL